MSETTDDLSTLAWVYEEVRRSLDTAHKALRRYAKEREASASSDVGEVDPSVLRGARVQIHQCVGALELIGLIPQAALLRASEAAVVRFVAKPHKLTPKAIEDVERASFALLDFLGRVLGGKTVSPLSLFPQYREIAQDAAADRVHPADLWSMPWRWLELPADLTAHARPPNAAARAAVERELLTLVRTDEPREAAGRLSDTFAGFAQAAKHAQVVTCWKLAAAVFEAQAHGLLGFDVYSKRLGSRLLAQFRNLARGEIDVSERLALDLLFFCAQSRPATAATPRLAAVRETYGLKDDERADYTTSRLGRYDPAWLTQARKRVAAAKDTWSAVAGGEMHRLSGLGEQFSLVGDSLKRLFPNGDLLAEGLQDAAGSTLDTGAAPPAPLAMEVATCLLYVDAVLEDADFDHPEQGERVKRLAQRLTQVRQGKAPDPLEAWMEELYRRVSDKQTMGSVVQELRSSLLEAEKLIDQFFRDISDPKPLIQVPAHLSAMRGVLSVLGIDHASAALARMRDEVDGLGSGSTGLSQAAQAGVFDRLAGNLGALGFLIDMLSVQPQMAKSLFVYDSTEGTLKPIMGRGADLSELTVHAALAGDAIEQQLIDQASQLARDATKKDVSAADLVLGLERLSLGASAADRTGLAQATRTAQTILAQAADGPSASLAREGVSKAMLEFVAPQSDVATLDPQVVPKAAAKTLAPIPAPASGPVVEMVQDDELREVFLEEAREVVADSATALAELNSRPGELPILTTIRRAFHTLKGSSRMVGLKDFGEAAWSCEKLFNTRLAEQRAAEPDLLEFTGWVLQYLGGWVEEISARRSHEYSSAVVSARALGLSGPAEARDSRVGALASASPAQPRATPAAPAAQRVPVVPASGPAALPGLEFSFDLDLPLGDEPAPTVAPVAQTDAAGKGEQALLEPFDLNPTEVSTLPLAMDEPAADIAIDMIDLDLGQGIAPAPAAVQSREPSRVMVQAEPHAPDLVLDLPDVRGGAVADSSGMPSSPIPLPEVVEEDAPGGDDNGGADEESVKVIGPLRISIALFNIYLNEADELSRRLTTELAEWAMELHRPIGEIPIALAHSLAGSSATVGFANLSNLARTLEHALTRSQAIGRGTPQEARLFVDAAEEIRRLLHQFAAGFLKDPSVTLLSRLDEHELSSARWLEAVTAAADQMPQTRPGALSDLTVADQRAAAGLPATFSITPPPAPIAPATSAPGMPVVAPNAPQRVSTAAPAPAMTPAAVKPADLPAAPRSAPPTAARDKPGARSPTAPQGEGGAEDDELRSWFQPSGFMEWKPLTYPPTGAAGAQPAAAPRSDAPVPASSSAAPVVPKAAAVENRRQAPRQYPAAPSALQDSEDDIDALDAVDAELFPIFEEEALELLPQLAGSLREWIARPTDTSHADACMRTLHTLKGGARLAGAMRLGELAHRLESRIERILAQPAATATDIEHLQSHGDALSQVFDALRNRDAQAYAEAAAALGEPSNLLGLGTEPAVLNGPSVVRGAGSVPATRAQSLEPLEPLAEIAVPVIRAPIVEARPPTPVAAAEQPARAASGDANAGIDWSRFDSAAAAPKAAADRGASATQSAVRVRTPLLDKLVNQAGEVSIARTRIESQVNVIKGSVADLTENLERLRAQLRDIELQAETQMSSRIEAAKGASKNFDPLEFDRFTRFQEVTRMMAESVNDVATVQRTLQRSLENTEDELVAQARMTRELQGDLLRTRMVEFEGLSDRLYRVVRQAAKELGKQVRLDIVGGSIEIDRGVLDRITGAFEHVLRNCVTHGIEMPQVRSTAGKDPTGLIVVTVTHEGNEVAVEFRDDGAGLNLPRIRERGLALGLLDAAKNYTDAELANLIFASGFSTATSVTELAGRGVGMDVVRSEVNAIGGRIRTATRANQGTSFKLILPLTTAVTQVLMLRCGSTAVAVPSTLIEIVRRATPVEIDQSHTSGAYTLGERQMPFFWLGSLLQLSPRSVESVGRTRTVVVIRSAQKRIAVQVDEVLGNQEVVVKNLGPQLSRVPGLVGITLLASGAVALIYNPVALATLYGEPARRATLTALQAPESPTVGPAADDVPLAPMVLVVDDSLTVRRVTQRLLVREGYRVVLAKDGLDALEKLAEERPQVVLSDIEMPRMDGFELVRTIRNSADLRDLPVIMITSRIAEKHRELAAELGVDHYMGKPYSEEDLLSLIAHYTATLTDA